MPKGSNIEFDRLAEKLEDFLWKNKTRPQYIAILKYIAILNYISIIQNNAKMQYNEIMQYNDILQYMEYIPKN